MPPRARMAASCAALVLLLGGGTSLVLLSLFALEQGPAHESMPLGSPAGATAPVSVAALDDTSSIGIAQPLPSAIDSSRLNGQANGEEPLGSGQAALTLTITESQKGNSVILDSVRSISRSTDGAVWHLSGPRVWV
jgi:hypothetical protein